jgi:uncharacterized protein (TIGR02246 family)
MSHYPKAAALALMTSLAGCSTRHDAPADRQKLMQTSREWSRAAAAGNVDAIVQYWADDAAVMMPGLPTFRGRRAIRAYVEQSLKTPGFHISWEPLEAHISKSGDMGYLLERSSVTMPQANGKLATQQFRGITIWTKDADGRWRNLVDASNAE